jgi:beta-lactamase class A
MQHFSDTVRHHPRKVGRVPRGLFVRHRQKLRHLGVGLVVFAAALGVIQLLYPANRTLPFVSAGGQSVGNKSVQQVTDVLDNDYKNAELIVATDAKRFERSFSDLGASVRTEEAAQRAADYPFWQRLIPFSSLVIMSTRDTGVETDFNKERVRDFAEEVQKNSATKAIDAKLHVKDGKVAATPSTPAKQYPVARVIEAIGRAAITPQTVARVTPSTTPAALQDEEAAASVRHIQELLDASTTVALNGRKKQVDSAVLGSWLTFKPNEAKDGFVFSVNPEAASLTTYLQDIQGDAYKAPGTTKIQLIDGREVSRTIGKSGRGVDVVKSAALLEQALKNRGDDTVSVAIGDLPPAIAYSKQFSNTDRGLTAAVQAAGAGGYSVAAMQMGGPSANTGGDKQFVAASTYKLYVAYAVFQEIAAGRMSWSTTISGRSAAQCFDAMIVLSDNPCAVAFGQRIGWGNITSMVRSIGVSSSTQLGYPMYTTANDLAHFLYRIENGSIVSAADRDRLIDAMKRQSYTRAGIPAGARGTVADKVGQVDGYVHDAAIVYDPDKTYVIVVMSYLGSWSGIANATSQVDAYFNR